MQNFKNINTAAKTLFFITGTIIFVSAFCLKNNFFTSQAKLILFLLDLPFLFFAILFFFTTIKISDYKKPIVESILMFFLILFFAILIFFHWAFPDLI